jgi:hypothetical protein
MKKNSIGIILGCALAILAYRPIGLAQTVTGAITGEVTDANGAVVAGAHVVAHNVATGVNTRTATNATGVYHIDNLSIGQYTLDVDATGFATQTIPVFSLESAQTATFNVKLAVHGTSASVEVTSAAPILNTQDYTISSTFTENTISNFPLNGLDFSALTLYVPGATSTWGNTGTTNIGRSTYYSDSVNLNGNRAQANNYVFEGIDINETNNNLISYSPAPGALQEIQVLAANSPADFGNVNGAGVVTVLKSGTNTFHGSAYGYVQDWRFNANSFQNKNHAGTLGDPISPINPFSQDQFGGTLGGPILHNKLFFFVDYLASRYHVGGNHYTSVLTAKMRNGDFSEVLAVQQKQLYDPLNNNQPYANNQGVPILNPVAQFLLAHPQIYPEPNSAPTDGVASNNYVGKQRTYKANNQGDIKIESALSDRNKITGFFSISTAYGASTQLLPIDFNGPTLYPTKLGGATWVHTFSPALVNKATLGYTRTVWTNSLSVDNTGLFGTNGDAAVGITFPNQTLQGYSYQGTGGIDVGGNPVNGGAVTDNTYSLIDTLSWEHGRHYFSTGVMAQQFQDAYYSNNNQGFLGSLGYSGAYTANSVSQEGGYGAADFLLGRISSAGATIGTQFVGQRQWRVGTWLTDDYKIRPNLTIHYGFRYELDQPWEEMHNKTGNIDLATGQVQYAHSVPADAPPGAGLCSNRGCYDWNFRQFMPRLGWAWQVNNRFVVRGGYSGSSFFEGNAGNQRLNSIAPFYQAVQNSVPAPNATQIYQPLNTSNAFSVGATQFATGGSTTATVYPKDIQPAYINNYNLTLEYALTNTLSLQVGYVGESGHHIEDYGNANQWKTPGDPTSAPYYNNQYIGCQTPSLVQVCSSALFVTESRAKMNYNGLQTVLRQRLSNSGLEYTVNYTYSKSMTNAVGNYGLNTSGYNWDAGVEDYYNLQRDYGVAGSDIKHNLTFTSTYALPFGQGQKYFSNANHAMDEVLGGWKIAASGIFYSGFPESVIGGDTGNVNSFGLPRYNQLRALHVHNRSAHNWFGDDPSAQFGDLSSNDPTQNCTVAGGDNGVCAFGQPTADSFGTSSNGALRGPGFHDVDMSAFKDFRVWREHSVGFRFDAFNAFNIVSYGNPDPYPGANFGHLVQENNIRSSERHLQFSAHYNF